MPAALRQIQAEFMSSYEAFKGNRTLIWKNNLGQVKLELEMSSKQTLEFSVTPVQAAVILKFGEKDTWSLLELSQSLKMCSFALRKKILFWKMQGLIKECEREAGQIGEQAESEAINEVYTLVKENTKVRGCLKKNKPFESFIDEGSGRETYIPYFCKMIKIRIDIVTLY